MLLLASTSDKVQVVTATGVTTIGIHASWMDYNAGTVTPGNTNNNITGAATTDAVPAPGASTQRNVKALTVQNSHATSSCKITVQLVNGSATVILATYTLLAGEVLQYFDGEGFQVMDANGGLKLSRATGCFQKRTIYTSGSNTFTPLSQSATLNVWVQGGGGGGGSSGTGNAGNDNAGGGGGSGGFTFKKYTVSASATYTAVVGGGGNGGVAASNNGQVGTLSSFTDGSTEIDGTGGLGGVFGPAIAAAPLVGPGGAGGAANANGDFNGTGCPGMPGLRLAAAVAISGGGGSSQFGGGGVGALNSRATGAAGRGYGSGGAGGENNAAGGATGGAGSGGIIIIDEYT